MKRNKDGFEVEAHAAEQRQIEAAKQPEQIELPEPASPTPTAPPGASVQPSWPPTNAVYAPYEADLIKRLHQAFGDNPELKLAGTIRLFSQARVERAHEMHYRMFYTSQIFALKRLNELVRVPAPAGGRSSRRQRMQTPSPTRASPSRPG